MEHKKDSDAVITYRYVRLAMFVLVAAIGVVVVDFSGGTQPLKGSISAYYYAPAGSVLVAAMVGIGALLICIKGSTPGEDALLNTAGMLAPLVGLVPTTPCNLHKAPVSPACRSLELGREDFISTTIWVIGAMAAVGFALLWFGSTYMEKRRPVDVPAQTTTRKRYAVLAIVLAAGLVAFYNLGYTWYLEYAHMSAAIGTFACIGLAAIVDGKHCISMGYPLRGRAYLVIGFALGVAAVVLPALNKSVWEFQPIFSAEAVGITAFAAFWLFQTIDLWWDATRHDMKARVYPGAAGNAEPDPAPPAPPGAAPQAAAPPGAAPQAAAPPVAAPPGAAPQVAGPEVARPSVGPAKVAGAVASKLARAFTL
jgi:hypothetical protein